MLSNILGKKKARKESKTRELKRQQARETLKGSAHDLILSMVCVEQDGVYTRGEIESSVLNSIRAYEELFYSMDASELDDYLEAMLAMKIESALNSLEKELEDE